MVLSVFMVEEASTEYLDLFAQKSEVLGGRTWFKLWVSSQRSYTAGGNNWYLQPMILYIVVTWSCVQNRVMASRGPLIGGSNTGQVKVILLKDCVTVHLFKQLGDSRAS